MQIPCRSYDWTWYTEYFTLPQVIFTIPVVRRMARDVVPPSTLNQKEQPLDLTLAIPRLEEIVSKQRSHSLIDARLDYHHLSLELVTICIPSEVMVFNLPPGTDQQQSVNKTCSWSKALTVEIQIIHTRNTIWMQANDNAWWETVASTAAFRLTKMVWQ